MQEIKKYIQGLTYFWSWNCSIFGGYLLFVPLIFLQILIPKLHRKILDLIVTYWQYYVTMNVISDIFENEFLRETFIPRDAEDYSCIEFKTIFSKEDLYEKLLRLFKTLLIRQNCQVHVTGDSINSDEVSIVISNHRTRVDWNFLWPVMYHAVEGKNKWWYSTKFVLKNSIKNIPGAGWVMQMVMYIFINRNWDEDKALLDDYIEYVENTKYKHTLILFPEGTDLTPTTKESSNKFAQANGLTEYKNVLHPRCTGFIYLVDEMRRKKCLDAVYDLTLIYPDECPQNEEELFIQGKFPKDVSAHLVRYPTPVLPDSKEGLKEFLEESWLKKEKTIEEFKKTGHFLHHGKILNKTDYLSLPWACFTHIIWITATGGLIFLLSVSQVYCCMVIIHTVALYVLPIFTNLTLFKIKKALWTFIARRIPLATLKDK